MSEIIIIGAGPAGSLAAVHLRRLGHQVLVLEKQVFPRFSIGESLLAQSVELLENAGLLEAVQVAGFQYKNGAAFARREQRASFNFAQKFSAGPGYTFQVPRAEFDHLLIREAEKLGAEVRFGCEVVSFTFDGESARLEWIEGDGNLRHMNPRFVLDASGFARVLPRLLDLESLSNQPSRLALFCQIYDCIPAGEFDRQKILVSIHPHHTGVWYWLIPFSDGRCSMGVVGSADFMGARRGTMDERLWALQREVPQLESLLRHAEPVFSARELKGYSANVSRMSGPGFALLGNAAEFLDPVFSSGVTIAMKSAALVAPLLSRQLRGGTIDWVGEFEMPLRYGVETFRAFVDTWYDGRLQEIFFYAEQDPKIHRMICSVLAGYAWDHDNPYTGPQAIRRLDALARTIKGHY